MHMVWKKVKRRHNPLRFASGIFQVWQLSSQLSICKQHLIIAHDNKTHLGYHIDPAVMWLFREALRKVVSLLKYK